MNKSILYSLAVTLFLLFAGSTPSQALLIPTALDFTTHPDQSIWGAGDANDFGASGSASIGTIGLSYSTSADSGTVSATFTGDLLVDYTPTLLTPGTTSLSLSFPGNTGEVELHSELGAGLKLTASALGLSKDIINKDYLLEIDVNNAPAELPQQISGRDSVTVGNSGVDLGVFEMGADYDIEQTDQFEASAINGTLAYSLSGNSTTSLIPFMLNTDTGLAFDLELDQVGIWNFWFVDIMLDNLFSTAFDAELVIYEEHLVGIDYCQDCTTILGQTLCSPSYPCGWDYDRNELTLADLDLYDGSPFALDFNTISSDSAVWSVEVGVSPAPEPVPEPSTILLLGSGLFGLGWYGWKRKKA